MADQVNKESIVPNVTKDNEDNKLSLMTLNANKAGMEGLDTEKINQIIEEASKGSKFYQHKQKSQEKITLKIEDMKASLSKLTEAQKISSKNRMDQLAAKMELARDLTRIIVHVDMDAFYAAVEMRDAPELKDKPMAVGSSSMLTTSNYHARRFGVRAAMPGFIAKKLCPDLVIVPTNFPKYTEVSRQVQQVFADYDPEFSAASLDEAYLDITDFLVAKPDMTPATAVQEMRDRILDKTQLTASAGIAPNGMLAKVCSDRNKPNGQFQLEASRDAVLNFVRPLPIRKISGIGNVTEQLLRGALGVSTCADLWEKRDLLALLFSESSYDYFLRVALGIGSDGVESERSERKSVSSETTFRASSDREELSSIIRQLAVDVSEDLRRYGLAGRGVTLKYKTEGFEVKTRIVQLHQPTDDPDIIGPAAVKLLPTGQMPKLRLLGVRMSHFNSDEIAGGRKKQRSVQELLIQPPAKKWKPDEAGPSSSLFTCPVCNSWQTLDGEVELNRHIDECLNRQVLDEDSTTNSIKRDQQTKMDRFLIRNPPKT